MQDKTIPRSSSSSKSTNSPEIQKGYTDRFENHDSQYSYFKTPQRSHQKESTQQAPTMMASSTTPPSTTARPPALVEALLAFARANHGAVVDKPGLKVLREMSQPGRLAPLSGGERPRTPNGWEVISAVVDSGATITALHPEDARDYKVEESEASRRGVTYGTAGKEDIANLGEKKIAVLTTEGTLRGFHSQIAEVSSPLESVRQLLGAKHCVLFGLGENEEEHLIVNKITGEVNRLRDDGTNYLHAMLVVPPDRIKEVKDAIDNGDSPFGGLGNGR